jgi:hypothetical protein
MGKYCDSHLSFGFTTSGAVSAPDAQCVVHNKVLHNCSTLLEKLRRHLETTHPDCTAKDILFFFKQKLEALETRQTDNQGWGKKKFGQGKCKPVLVQDEFTTLHLWLIEPLKI